MAGNFVAQHRKITGDCRISFPIGQIVSSHLLGFRQLGIFVLPIPRRNAADEFGTTLMHPKSLAPEMVCSEDRAQCVKPPTIPKSNTKSNLLRLEGLQDSLERLRIARYCVTP